MLAGPFILVSGGNITDYATKLVTKDSNWTKYVYPLRPNQDGFYKIRVEMRNASGKVYFDNIRFSNGEQISEYTYDADNNYVTEIKNQLNNKLKYENNSYGQVTKMTTPTGEVTEYSYDGQGALQTVKDNSGNVATYALDNNGNVTDVVIKESGTTPVYESSFEYDEYGNMVKEIAKPDLGQPANDKTTEYLYDESDHHCLNWW